MIQLKMTMMKKSYIPCFQEKEVECQKCRKYQVTKRKIQCLTKKISGDGVQGQVVQGVLSNFRREMQDQVGFPLFA